MLKCRKKCECEDTNFFKKIRTVKRFCTRAKVDENLYCGISGLITSGLVRIILPRLIQRQN